MARDRNEILKDIASAKLKKVVAFALAALLGGAGFYYQNKQEKHEYELLILDEGRLDQVILQ